MLRDRIDYYETGQKLNNTPAQLRKNSLVKEVDSLALANAQMNLNKAYSHFWNDSKHFGKKPRFKSRKIVVLRILRTTRKALSNPEGHKVKLPKVGWVKLCQHRPLPENSIIRNGMTISKTPSGSTISVCWWSMKTKYSCHTEDFH